MLPTFDPDETAPYDSAAQDKYAHRLKGDQQDRHRAEWLHRHDDTWRLLGRSGMNMWMRQWRRWHSRTDAHHQLRLYPRHRDWHEAARLLNRRARQRMRAALRQDIECDAREYEERLPWQD